MPPPAPVAPADQARFDAVARCRARVEAYKRDGVDPARLVAAVEDLQAAVAEAPDLPPPPLPPAPIEETEQDQDPIDPAADGAHEQEN